MNESMRVELFLFWLIDMGYIRIYFVPLILSSDCLRSVALTHAVSSFFNKKRREMTKYCFKRVINISSTQ